VLQTQPLFDLLGGHQFGSADLEVVFSIWGTGGNPMVPNQDYTKDKEKFPSAKRSRVSLW
jgi:hypothetical protein